MKLKRERPTSFQPYYPKIKAQLFLGREDRHLHSKAGSHSGRCRAEVGSTRWGERTAKQGVRKGFRGSQVDEEADEGTKVGLMREGYFEELFSVHIYK